MDRTAEMKRRLVSTELAAMAAGVSDGTIRKWASRGKINRFGSPQKALYDLDELMRLVVGASVRPHSSDRA
ncbi:MAG: hypothetical protein HOV87_04580 [Catenulispora sp.]|nr:hypothetical protein [Catenulispora sp.]